MAHSTARTTVTRAGAATALAVGLAVLGGGAAGADPLPSPLPSPLAQTAADLADAVAPGPSAAPDRTPSPLAPTPLDGVSDQLTGAVSGQGGAGASGQGTTTPDDGPKQAPTSQGPAAEHDDTQSGRASASPQTGSQPKAGARVSSDALTACIIPTGSASPAVEFDLSVLGNDAGSPLAESIPQVFTPCPEGAVPADDTVVGADVDVPGLLGACVRVTREVAPLQTTLIVLDHDVIAALTDAGLPLEQLLVPCPAGAQVPGTATPPGAGGNAPSDRPASAVPSLPGRLAFTGADTVPLASLAAVLLSLGALLTRQARRLRPCASRG
jgi:hypothetical protein